MKLNLAGYNSACEGCYTAALRARLVFHKIVIKYINFKFFFLNIIMLFIKRRKVNKKNLSSNSTFLEACLFVRDTDSQTVPVNMSKKPRNIVRESVITGFRASSRVLPRV